MKTEAPYNSSLSFSRKPPGFVAVFCNSGNLGKKGKKYNNFGGLNS
jgi:hypothetical protein